jgi:hypothetical protein
MSGPKVERRQVKVAEAFMKNLTRRQIAAEVGTNLAAVKRDLAALSGRFQAENSEAFAEYRKAQLAVLELMEESLVTGKASPDVVNAWRGVRGDISKLLGLDAPTKSISVNLSGALQGLSIEQQADVAAYARTLTESVEHAPDIVVNFVTPKKEQQ